MLGVPWGRYAGAKLIATEAGVWEFLGFIGFRSV